MDKIKCQCGNEFNKDYNSATIIVENSFDISFVKKENLYSWRCSDCGQIFLEKIKKPIELD